MSADMCTQHVSTVETPVSTVCRESAALSTPRILSGVSHHVLGIWEKRTFEPGLTMQMVYHSMPFLPLCENIPLLAGMCSRRAGRPACAARAKWHPSWRHVWHRAAAAAGTGPSQGACMAEIVTLSLYTLMPCHDSNDKKMWHQQQGTPVYVQTVCVLQVENFS